MAAAPYEGARLGSVWKSMEERAERTLEQALARTENDAETTLKAAAAVTSSLKRVRAAAHNGNLRDLRPALDAAQDVFAGLRQQLANTKEQWDFDEESYFASGGYQRELLAAAREAGLRMFEQDDRLYAYPSLVQVVPAEPSVLIDKTRERRLRPSVLVAHLKDLQRRPPRFRPEAFLESLYAAYRAVAGAMAARRGNEELLGDTPVVRLMDVYDILTLLPGQSREYSRQEFARDIYLLDQSGMTTTRRGETVSFPASTGTRTSSATLRVISQNGHEKLYFGVQFRGAS